MSKQKILKEFDKKFGAPSPGWPKEMKFTIPFDEARQSLSKALDTIREETLGEVEDQVIAGGFLGGTDEVNRLVRLISKLKTK